MKDSRAFDLIEELHSKGISYAKIAKELNSRGLKTKLGKPFSDVSAYNVHKVYKRLGTTPNKAAKPQAPARTPDKAYLAYIISNLETSLEALKTFL